MMSEMIPGVDQLGWGEEQEQEEEEESNYIITER